MLDVCEREAGVSHAVELDLGGCEGKWSEMGIEKASGMRTEGQGRRFGAARVRKDSRLGQHFLVSKMHAIEISDCDDATASRRRYAIEFAIYPHSANILLPRVDFARRFFSSPRIHGQSGLAPTDDAGTARPSSPGFSLGVKPRCDLTPSYKTNRKLSTVFYSVAVSFCSVNPPLLEQQSQRG